MAGLCVVGMLRFGFPNPAIRVGPLPRCDRCSDAVSAGIKLQEKRWLEMNASLGLLMFCESGLRAVESREVGFETVMLEITNHERPKYSI